MNSNHRIFRSPIMLSIGLPLFLFISLPVYYLAVTTAKRKTVILPRLGVSFSAGPIEKIDDDGTISRSFLSLPPFSPLPLPTSLLPPSLPLSLDTAPSLFASAKVGSGATGFFRRTGMVGVNTFWKPRQA